MTTPAEPTSSSGPRSSSARSSAAPGSPKPGKKDNVFTRKVGPLPAWAWMAIIAAALLLFVMWRGNKTSSTGAAGGKQGGGGRAGGFGGALLPPVVTHARHGHRKHRAGDDDDEQDDDDDGRHKGKVNPGGPNRRKRRRDRDEDQDERDRRHRRDHDDAAQSASVTTRPVPGQPASGVRGQLMSFTTAADGPTPSLAQVASDNNTAPDAIIEEATGRGNPHGAMWRRYVARHDWQAPLPHGTDMTILRQPK